MTLVDEITSWVRTVAEDIRVELDEYGADAEQLASEAADGCGWVIYPARAVDYIAATGAEHGKAAVQGAGFETSDFDELAVTVVYYDLRHRIMEELGRG